MLLEQCAIKLMGLTHYGAYACRQSSQPQSNSRPARLVDAEWIEGNESTSKVCIAHCLLPKPRESVSATILLVIFMMSTFHKILILNSISWADQSKVEQSGLNSLTVTVIKPPLYIDCIDWASTQPYGLMNCYNSPLHPDRVWRGHLIRIKGPLSQQGDAS